MTSGLSQSNTWSGNIASIIYANCTSCHHSGGAGPFSMMTYNQTINNSRSIRNAIANHTMPPWPPDVKYKSHAFNRVLSDPDYTAIMNWLDNGMASGDMTKAPAAPTYDNLGYIKNPDLVMTLPKYTLNSNVDEYRCFPDSTHTTKDMWLTAIECVPGTAEIVHHVLIFIDKNKKSYGLDAKEPGPGYVCFGGAGVDADLIGLWVPGSQPYSLPKGFGMKFPANATIIVQVHYPAGQKGKSDQTKIKFQLTDQPQREAFLLPALNHVTSMTNGPLVIPPNEIKKFNEKFVLPTTASLIGVAPHMHNIGVSIKTWGVTADGKELPWISIPNWDFHWQGLYMFDRIQKIPAFTTLYSEAIYDNTTANHHNPNNPPKEVKVGEATTDEMMLTYFLFALYAQGDENIIIDSAQALKTTPVHVIKSEERKIKLSPNPITYAKSTLLQYVADINDNVHITVYDIHGRAINQYMINNISAGVQTLQMNTEAYHPGVYLIKLEGSKWMSTVKMLVD